MFGRDALKLDHMESDHDKWLKHWPCVVDYLGNLKDLYYMDCWLTSRTKYTRQGCQSELCFKYKCRTLYVRSIKMRRSAVYF